MINIFIGFDFRETQAFHALCHSIITKSSKPVSITPIKRNQLPEYNRPYKNQSNEFTYTRFLVPYLSEYKGISIFLDSDMLVNSDIYELIELHDKNMAVSVVKHDYIPKKEKAFGKNTSYPRKNWSSVMVFSNEKCKVLTTEYVNNASPEELHRFKWIDDNLIGGLPIEWNHLVGEYDYNSNAKLIHHTLGTPCFNDYKDEEYADLYYRIVYEMNRTVDNMILQEE